MVVVESVSAKTELKTTQYSSLLFSSNHQRIIITINNCNRI